MDDSVRFGRFELRRRSRLLLADGEPVALGGRAFDLLSALVDRRDRVVPRAELVELVWPRRVVEENNLAVQVLALRRALGEQAVVTVPGRGYRFALPVDGDVAGVIADPDRDRSWPRQPPAPFSAMHGRAEDLQTLLALLDTQRLVTVVGAGGIGKSTLAAAAARERATAWADGVAWVELGAVTDAAQLPSAVGQALGLEIGRRDGAAAALAATLRPRRLLVVLDSAEHLVEAAATLAHHLLTGAPGVRLLVTSQMPLKVEGERVLRLGTLAVPNDGTSAAQALAYGAVALFVDQIRARDPRFEFDDERAAAVIALCRRLDGLPLALKLAAARAPVLGLRELHSRLEHSLRLLGGGARDAPTRQQTLRATLDWSHGLLSSDAQAVFRRLGVFAGGFALDAAQAVAADATIDRWAVVDHLATLVERSLVEADRADPPRYRLLASAREYALAELERAGETEALRRRHAQTYAALAETAESALWTTGDAAWLARHVPEIDNWRAALAWSVPCDVALGASIAGAGVELFQALTLRHELRSWCDALEGTGSLVGDGATLARYWLMRAWSLSGSDHRKLQLFAARAEELYRALGDERGLYLTLCVRAMGIALPVAMPPASWLDEALALERPQWPPRLRTFGWMARTLVRNFENDHAGSLDAAEAGIRLAASAGAGWYAHFLLGWRAAANLALRRVDSALHDTSAMLRRRGQGPSGFASLSFGLRAQALLMARRSEDARAILGQLFDLLRAADWDSMHYYCDTYVLMALREQRADDAVRLIGYANEACPPIGLHWPRSVAFRERALATLVPALGGEACERLLAEGRAFDAEGMCAVTLRRR